MPIPNTIVAVSFSKSSLPKYDYFLSQWVAKYQGQYNIHYFSDIWGIEFRQQVENIDPILMVHNGHGYPVAWLCQFPNSWPIEEYCAMHYMHSPLMEGRIGISHACYTAESIGGRWGVAGIAYFGYDDISYTINPFEEYNYPYRDDWYWMENGINDYFCQGHTLGDSFAFQLDEFDRLIEKWSTERPNEYWTRYVGYAGQMKARAKILGNPSIKLDGTIAECSPDGITKCIYYDLYECINGQWVLIEPYSEECDYPPECSPEGSIKCEGYDLFQCMGGKWVLIEPRSDRCGYTPPPPDWKKWLIISGIAMSAIGLGLIYQSKNSP